MGIKTCPNGHKYDDSLPECPFCPKPAKQKRTVPDRPAVKKTVPDNQSSSPSATRSDKASSSGDATRVVDKPQKSRPMKHGKTRIVSSQAEKKGQKPRRVERARGKLVGWLVTFSWQKLGQDYPVREGRTRIGSDSACDIRLEDALASGDHAQMVYRKSTLKIRDSFSTNGTLVNGEDIGDDPTELHDGDIIQIGNTVFKLRLIGDVPNA